MGGCIIPPTDTGHHGTLGIMDMVVMDLVSMDARRETLIPNLKENLMLTLGCIIPPTDTGHHGTLDITDMVVMDLVSMDARRETLMPSQKENLMLTLGCIIPPTDTGQHDTMVTTVLMDGTTGIAPANNHLVQRNVLFCYSKLNYVYAFQNFTILLKFLSKLFNLLKS